MHEAHGMQRHAQSSPQHRCTHGRTLTHARCIFLCVVLAASYLNYRRYRLSCLPPFAWHFLFILTCAHTHTHTRTRTHTHTHAHTHAHTHTHTHTHTPVALFCLKNHDVLLIKLVFFCVFFFFRKICMLELSPWLVCKHPEVQAFLPMAVVHRDDIWRQCPKTPRRPRCVEGQLWSLWQWTGAWVPWWRPRWRVTLLNFQQQLTVCVWEVSCFLTARLRKFVACWPTLT